MSAPGGSGPSRPSRELTGQDPASRVKTPGAAPSEVSPNQPSPSEVLPPSLGDSGSTEAAVTGSVRSARSGKARGAASRGKGQAGRQKASSPGRSESSGQRGTRRSPGSGLDPDAKADRTTATGSAAVAAEGTANSMPETPAARSAVSKSANRGSLHFTATPPLMVVESEVLAAPARAVGGQEGPSATEAGEVRPRDELPKAIMGEEAEHEPQAGPGEPARPDESHVPGLGSLEPSQSATPVESYRISPEPGPEKQTPAPDRKSVV